MKILSLATKSDGYLPVLKILCEKHGHDLIILEYGNKWKGFSWRTRKYIEKLKELELCNPNEIVMIIDAYDVLVLADHNEIIEKYNEYKCDVLFSASCKKTGQPNYSYVYDIGFKSLRMYFKSKNDYVLNAGSLMGNVKSLKIVYQRIYDRYRKTLITDDQINLNNIDISDINYKIDTQSHIFWIWERNSLSEHLSIIINDTTYEATDNIKYTKGRIQFNSYNITPCVVHGIANRNMDKLCKNNKIPLSVISQLKKKSIVQDDIAFITFTVKIVFTILLIYLIFKISKNFIKNFKK